MLCSYCQILSSVVSYSSPKSTLPWKGILVAYITRGHGAGQVMINLAKLGVPPKEWNSLARVARQKRQIRHLEVTREGWLLAKIETNHLGAVKLERVVEKIHNELIERAKGFVPTALASNS